MRTVAVLGAAGGIGRAIVEALLNAGDTVYLLDREPCREKLTPLIAATPERARFLACDLTDGDSIQAAFQTLEQHAGTLDACINAAGTIHRGAFLDVTPEELQAMLAVNVTGAFQALQAASRLMIASGGGRIVCLSSVHGLRTGSERSAYALCKGAILALTRALAVELGPRGILVNALAPGPVSTGMQEADSESRRRWQATTPLDRVAQAHEVARAAVFLASADNTFINGDTLIVDGGANVTIGSIA